MVGKLFELLHFLRFVVHVHEFAERAVELGVFVVAPQRLDNDFIPLVLTADIE